MNTPSMVIVPIIEKGLILGEDIIMEENNGGLIISKSSPVLINMDVKWIQLTLVEISQNVQYVNLFTTGSGIVHIMLTILVHRSSSVYLQMRCTIIT